MRSFLVVALCVRAAAADPMHSPAELAEAAKLMRAAEDAAQAGAYRHCAQGYLALYRQFPDVRGDEVLFDALRCAGAAGLPGEVVRDAEELITSFPQSPLGPRTLWEAGHALADLGQFAAAAEKLEDAAKLYAGERESPVALMEAASYRRGLGQLDKMRTDIELFMAGYGAKLPADTARAMLGLVLVEAEHARKPAQLKAAEASLAEWLKLFARAEPALQAVVHEKLGELMWSRACPGGELDGLCVVAKAEKLPRGCDLPAGPALTARKRTPRLVAEAQKHFALSRDLGRELTNEGPDGVRALVAATTAERFLADAKLEAVLSLPARAKDLRAINDLGRRLQALATEASEAYRVSAATALPFAALPALARDGQLTLAVARIGARWALHGGIAAPEACASEPLLDRARETFRACMATGEASSTFDRWYLSCQNSLSELGRSDEARAPELLAPPRVSAASSRAGVVSENPIP
jgi:hypothetical protein